jgi:hypothetical protein
LRSSYNAQHRYEGLPANKQTVCPLVAPENGTWVETLEALAVHHRFVGEKIAFGAFEPDRFVSECLAFQHRYFHAGAYVLMFRNPRDAILSPRSAWTIQNLMTWAISYIVATRGLIRLRRNFPRTVPVFLETIEPATFQAIEKCLDCSMPGLPTVMVRMEESPRDPEQIPVPLQDVIGGLEALYPELRAAVLNAGRRDSDAGLGRIDSQLAALRSGLGRAPSYP